MMGGYGDTICRCGVRADEHALIDHPLDLTVAEDVTPAGIAVTPPTPCEVCREPYCVIDHRSTIVIPLDGLEETIAREVASWSDPRVWEHIPADVQERYLDKGRRLVARALAGDGAR